MNFSEHRRFHHRQIEIHPVQIDAILDAFTIIYFKHRRKFNQNRSKSRLSQIDTCS